ncbi:MAG: ATP-binding protein [Pseudomonadales bacterium]
MLANMDGLVPLGSPALADRGEMTRRIRSFGWEQTSLGPLESWSPERLFAVRMVADNPCPQMLMWGPELIVCAYNDACRPLLSTEVELLGRSVFEVWGAMETIVAPHLAALAGEGGCCEAVPFVLTRSGCPGESFFDLWLSPVRVASGAVGGVLNTAFETTGRVLAERQLRTQEQQASHGQRLTRALLDHTSVLIAVVQGHELRFTLVNSACQALRPGVEITGRSYSEVFPEAAAAGAETLLREVWETGEPRLLTGVRAPLTATTDACWNVQIVRLPLIESEPAALLMIAQDVTEHHRTAAALRESGRRKDEFLATLAHELRNPLAPIQSGIDVLRLSGDEQTSVRVLEMMQRQMVHVRRLVDDLLDVSRVTLGKVVLRKEPVDVVEVIRSALENGSSALRAGERQGSVHLPAEPLRVHADPVRLAQIFMNLLDNAVKYSQPGGRVWIAATREGGSVRVSVRDDGVGIPPKMLREVFGMFVQNDAGSEGLGIGLTLVQHLVELHGGTVEARSDGPGRGSEFLVTLPLIQSEPATVTATGTKSSLRGRRLLVIDDNKDAAVTLGMLLEAMGAEVRTAFDGATGLALLKTHPVDTILLDIGMPEMDGYEVARRVRAEHAGEPIQLVAVTGWGQHQDRLRATEAGFDRHVVKPVSIALLEKAISVTPGT